MIPQIGMAADRLLMGGAIQRFLRKLGIGALVLLTLAIAVRVALGWHHRQIERVRTEAMQEQSDLIAGDLVAAAEQAMAEQAALVTTTAASSARITKGSGDALDRAYLDIARRDAAVRRLLAEREARAAAGSAGKDAAAALSDVRPPADLTACDAQGWVRLQDALEPATAADRLAAQLNGLLDDIAKQEAAWPKD